MRRRVRRLDDGDRPGTRTRKAGTGRFLGRGGGPGAGRIPAYQCAVQAGQGSQGVRELNRAAGPVPSPASRVGRGRLILESPAVPAAGRWQQMRYRVYMPRCHTLAQPGLCLNCSAPMAGLVPEPRYCPACGQETQVLSVPLVRLRNRSR